MQGWLHNLSCTLNAPPHDHPSPVTSPAAGRRQQGFPLQHAPRYCRTTPRAGPGRNSVFRVLSHNPHEIPDGKRRLRWVPAQTLSRAGFRSSTSVTDVASAAPIERWTLHKLPCQERQSKARPEAAGAVTGAYSAHVYCTREGNTRRPSP